AASIANGARAFADAGAAAQILRLADPRQAAPLARRAADAGHRIVVAAGGDGTVSTVAGALAGTRSALGVVPMGTLNHFARDLKVPIDVAEAAKAIVQGRETRVDIGEVNGRVFVNNSSIGLYPSFLMHRRHQERLGRGRW